MAARKKRASADADVDAVSAVAGAAGHEASGVDAEATHDAARTTRDRGLSTETTRVNQDIGADEAASSHLVQQTHAWDQNAKRTYDLHQTWDGDALLAARGHAADLQSLQIRGAEATLLHTAKINSLEITERQQDHAQRVRFADATSTVQITVLADMAKAVSDSARACEAACAALAKK